MSPHLALNGRAGSHQICPLLKVDRPYHRAAVTSQFDSERTWATLKQAVSEADPIPFKALARSDTMPCLEPERQT
jgi:hypothetical protein